MTEPERSDSRVRDLEREVEVLRSAIWAFFRLAEDARPAQAESLLRSALPDDYRPVGASTRERSDSQERSLHVAYDGTLGQPWTVVVRVWDAAATAWRGIATVGQIATSPDHAAALVRDNGPWPRNAEFVPHPPGAPLGALVWGQR